MSKKKRVVFFIFSPEEVKFTLQYIKQHPERKVRILAGSLEAQLQLNHGLGHEVKHALIHFPKSPHYYQQKAVNYYKKSSLVYKYMQKRVCGLQVMGINLVEVLRLIVKTEFLSVLYARDIYHFIDNNWKPDQYIFSQHLKSGLTGWDADHFAIAAIIKDYFCPPEKMTCVDVNHKIRQHLNLAQIKKILTNPKSWIINGEALINRLLAQHNVFRKNTVGIDVLFYSAGLHLLYYQDVFNQIAKTEKIDYKIITGNQGLTHEWTLKKKNIEFISQNTLLNNFDQARLNKWNKKILRQINSLLSNTKGPDNFFPKYLTLECRQALWHKLVFVVNKYYQKFIRQIIIAQNAIKLYKPRLLVTTHDPGPSSLPFVILAKQYNIPSLVFMHGFHDLYFQANHQSDYIATWGNYFQMQYIRQLNKKKNTIYKVGFPALDNIWSQTPKKAKTPKFSSPLRMSFLLTLYLVDPLAIYRFLDDAFSALSRSGIEVIIDIRTHSGQFLKAVQELVKYCGLSCEYNRNCSLNDFILQSDVVYSWDTTAILWVMIHHKPLFYSTPWWGEGFMPVKKHQAAWIPRSADDFVYQLTKLVNNPKITKKLYKGQQKFLKQTLGVVDSSASTKTADLLLKMIKQKDD